mgnify:CR=1 FL=1
MFAAKSALDRGLDAFERRDWKRARKSLEEALQIEERAVGHYHLGLLYWRGLGGPREVEAGVDCFARAAAQAYPAAQTAYAMALRSGVGAKRDVETARSLFREAAGAGDATAMIELATLSPPDDARYWMLRASEMGSTAAMAFYADMLMARDPTEALAWLYAAAALSGDDAPRKRAAALAREMSAAEIDAAQKAGRGYAKRIQDKGRKQQ